MPFMSASTATQGRARSPSAPVAQIQNENYRYSRNPGAQYTLDGSERLEQHLERVVQQVLSEILRVVSAERLEGLVLGGGYGRGEGGVLRTGAGDQPYNDLEFYIFLRGNHWLNQRRYAHALHAVAERLSSSAGLEIEFKILPLAKLRRSPPSMFYYDLVMGHRQVWGAPDLLTGCEHHRDPTQIPLAEATRLLMNRCSGLLFASEKLAHPAFRPEDADFVGRNLAKPKLALGDALLTAHHQYHWSCLERNRRLQTLRTDFPRIVEVQRHHAAGVDFKLHPFRTSDSPAALLQAHQEIRTLALDVWLWLESRRLGLRFPDIRAYALSPINKCPETRAWRNCLVNLQSFGLAGLLCAAPHRHPRERLFGSLALLLWDTESCADQAIVCWLQKTLRTSAGTLPDLMQAYRSLWKRRR
jgi:hypothetical protein